MRYPLLRPKTAQRRYRVTCLISDIVRRQHLIVSARAAEGRDVGVMPTSRSGGLCRMNAR
jgi:hypothetical protein